jgi:hypothetical protein
MGKFGFERISRIKASRNMPLAYPGDLLVAASFRIARAVPYH